MYLETFPTEEFLVSQMDDIQKKLDAIQRDVDMMLHRERPATKEAVADFEKIRGKALLKKQLQTLKYFF